MSRWRNGTLLAIGLVAFAGLCWWFGLDELGAAARSLDPMWAAAYAFLAIVVLAAYATRWWVVARWLGSGARWKDVVACRLAGDAVGTLLPSTRMSGDPLRAYLLRDRGVPGPLAAASVTADRIFETFGNTLIAIVAVVVFSWTRTLSLSRAESEGVLLVMALLLASLVLPVVLLRRGYRPFSSMLGERLSRMAPILRRTRRVLHETEDHLMAVFRRPPSFLLTGILASLAIEGVILLELYCLLVAFGIRLDIGMLLMATILSGLARSIPTPAGLGAVEGAQVALFALSVQDPALGFVVALVLRLHETIWVAVGLAALSGLRSRGAVKLAPQPMRPR